MNSWPVGIIVGVRSIRAALYESYGTCAELWRFPTEFPRPPLARPRCLILAMSQSSDEAVKIRTVLLVHCSELGQLGAKLKGELSGILLQRPV
jgi:hypothetical protein